MKIVLDTNVLISGIFWKGTPYKVIQEWYKGRFDIVASKSILKEYFDVLQRIDTEGTTANQWALLLTEKVILVSDRHIISLSRDSDDDKFINTALVGRALYLVTGDDDLLSIKDAISIEIITPHDFVKKIQ